MSKKEAGADTRCLGHAFANADLLRRAFTHRSFANEQANRPGQGVANMEDAAGTAQASKRDNERLEFLGDAVLDLVISHLLMDAHPRMSEGELSNARAALVSEPALADIARTQDFGDKLLLGKGEETSGGRDKPSLLSDTFEAVIAAIYLDGGFLSAQKAITTIFEARVLAAKGEETLDFKTRLQEHVQALGQPAPTYTVIEETGPDHEKHFTVAAMVAAQELGRGEGKTKKSAEQAAAQRALAEFK